MLKAVNRVNIGWLDPKSLTKFHCKDLKTIDHLWVTASDGHFGFSVQKKIWEDCGSPTDFDNNWDKFCVVVGWQNKQATAYVDYTRLKLKPSLSPKGELPLVNVEVKILRVIPGGAGVRVVNGSSAIFLFSRAKTCEV